MTGRDYAQQIVRGLAGLPRGRLVEIADFAEFVRWRDQRVGGQGRGSEEFGLAGGLRCFNTEMAVGEGRGDTALLGAF